MGGRPFAVGRFRYSTPKDLRSRLDDNFPPDFLAEQGRGYRAAVFGNHARHLGVSAFSSVGGFHALAASSGFKSHSTLLMKQGTRRRLWFWRFAHYWSIVRFRRRVILAAVALGLMAAAVITLSTTQVFQAKAVIQDAGVDSNGVITNPPPPHGIEMGGDAY